MVGYDANEIVNFIQRKTSAFFSAFNQHIRFGKDRCSEQARIFY